MPVLKEMDNSFSLLIAEDNLPSRMLIEKVLLSEGYGVTSVENGRDALERLKKQFFPIIITDWEMPEMNGLELCRAVRARNFARYTFIILVTANDAKAQIIEGLEAGADDYITKPFNRAELIARINTGKRIIKLERSLLKANEEIRILSITDPLTQVYNRGYMSKRMTQEIKRAKRYSQPLSLIICDIDHFKKVNDLYGHHAGDLVLKKFAGRLKGCIRDGADWIARYGGEEFLIVLPETDVKGARKAAERFRRSVAEKTFNIEEKEIRITASFGVAGFGSSADNEEISFQSLLCRSDKCLYQAKDAGRNRIESMQPFTGSGFRIKGKEGI